MTFKDLQLSAPLLKALEEKGYTTPSPIQEKAIPHVLAGKDVLGCAQTGPGKTAAFARPIIQNLMRPSDKKHSHPDAVTGAADCRKFQTIGFPYSGKMRRHIRRSLRSSPDQRAAARH